MDTPNTNAVDVSVEKRKGLERRITVRVPTTQIEQEIDTRLKKVGRTAKLKGFRPGKIPAKVVLQHYGGQVRQEVISDTIRASYSRALVQEGLNPAGDPNIEPITVGDEEHFSYQATFEVYPEIKLKPTKTITVETPRVAFDESDVDEMVEKLSEEDPKFAEALERGGTVAFLFFFLQMIVAVIYPLETLLLWWLPRKLAVSYLGIIFSYEPHKDLPIGRYKDSRFWSNAMPRFLNHSMQIHAMHHMYPNICHYDEPKAIEALKPFMVARGMPGAEEIPEKIKLNPLIRAFS